MDDTLSTDNPSPEHPLPSDAHSQNTQPANASEAPQFGAIDIVEAFTALRHEFRNQAKDSRALAEQLIHATEHIEQVKDSLLKSIPSNKPSETSDAVSMDSIMRTLVEFDIQLTRAVQVAVSDERWRTDQQRQQEQAIDQSIASMSSLARWFARPLINSLNRKQARNKQEASRETSPVSALSDGLSILLTKLRQALDDHQIQRIETLGMPFNGETMKSIGVLSVDGIASGHVSEQISAAYVCKQSVIKFANVRVAP